jgi:hypothetical protein
MSELQTLSEYMADSIAQQMCMCGHTLLLTGLDPDALLQAALKTFAEKVPGFKDAAQETLQLFADSLAVALCDRLLMEHDIVLIQRRGVTPC